MQKSCAKEQTNTCSFTDFCLMYNGKSEEYLQCKHTIWEAQKPWKSIKFFREMANLSKKILPKSSENARSQSEIFRGPTKKNFRQIASKLTELQHFTVFSFSPREVVQTALKMPGIVAKSWEVPPKKISGKSHENWLS